jgi:hypothetical protein
VLISPYDGKLGKRNASTHKDWGMYRARVGFSPFTFPSSFWKLPGASPIEILVHELTHAVRIVSKKSFVGVPGELTEGEYYIARMKEEAIAMIVTNIFASETHRCLRLYYEASTDWAAEHYDPAHGCEKGQNEDVESRYRFEAHDLYAENPDFVKLLARVDAPYNPFRGGAIPDVTPRSVR